MANDEKAIEVELTPEMEEELTYGKGGPNDDQQPSQQD